MNTDRKPKISAQEIFTAHLLRVKGRKTPERFAILDCIAALPCHFVINDVYQAMAKTPYPVSRTTIYSTLRLLEDCGLVASHTFDRGATRYERVSTPSVSHQHLVCTQCGKVRDAKLETLMPALLEQQFKGFKPSHFDLTIYGVCTACRRSHRKQKTK